MKDPLYEPGDKIFVWIGKRMIETTIDEHGTQRLPSNPVYRELYDCGLFDLNEMAIAYQSGLLSFESYFEFYLHIGYSVCSFAELSPFEHLEIVNPMWEK